MILPRISLLKTHHPSMVQYGQPSQKIRMNARAFDSSTFFAKPVKTLK
jgi:hypothetical protein